MLVVGFWVPPARGRARKSEEPTLNRVPCAGRDELPPRPEGKDTNREEKTKQQNAEKGDIGNSSIEMACRTRSAPVSELSCVLALPLGNAKCD